MGVIVRAGIGREDRVRLWPRKRAPASDDRYELLSRGNCHLCDEMKELLDRVLPAENISYRLVDVDTRTEWRERFGEVVPVLLRNGRPVAKVRLDRKRLLRIVRRRRPEGAC